MPIASPWTPDLGGIQEIYIESSDMANACCLDSKDTYQRGYLSLLDVVPLSGACYGYPVSYAANDVDSNILTFQKAKTLRKIHIRLTDSHGNTLTLPGNQEADIIFKIF